MKVHPAVFAGGAAVLLYLFFKHKSSSSTASANYSDVPLPSRTSPGSTTNASNNTSQAAADAQDAQYENIVQQQAQEKQAQADAGSGSTGSFPTPPALQGGFFDPNAS